MANWLDDVVAAQTTLSEVDGIRGRLVLRGRTLDELSTGHSFEEVIALLWEGLFELPPTEIRETLGRARVRVFSEIAALDGAMMHRSPLDAMRALVARLEDGDDIETALLLVAAASVFTTAFVNIRQGRRPAAPDPSLGHALDTLRMLRGASPDDGDAAALDTYLITVSDHGLNASTFAARVTASTHAGLVSAALSGLSALKGPLHGGAPGPVLEMLNQIGEAANAGRWLKAALDRNERLMGFGHRIYRVRDPRADALKRALQRLDRPASSDRLRLAEAVEAVALDSLREHKPDRRLETNVEFYTAVLLEALGFPQDAFTCVFAMGRMSGWMAHAREQVASGRLIRPQSIYVGPPVRTAA